MIIKCCVANCNEIFSQSDLINHMIWDHTHWDISNLEETESNEKKILCFDQTILNFGENINLGVLLYTRNG